MGTLANSFFRILMGWIRSLSSEVWKTITSPDSATILKWVGDHWKMLALLLCLAGLAADLIIYLFRWQPYRVWGSFFRRMRTREEDEEENGEVPENPEEPAAQAETEPAYIPAETSVQPFREQARERQEYEEPLSWRREELEGTTAYFEQAIRPNRKRRVRHLFSDTNEETVSPDRLIDQYAAYRRPVYPRNWKQDEKEEDHT